MANELKGLIDITTGVEKTDANSNGIFDLSIFEITQLANIDSSTISTTQWGYLGLLDQNLNQGSSPAFVGLTLAGQGIISVSTGTSNNDKFVTQGYADDLVSGAGYFQRVGTVLSPFNAGDDLDMTGGSILATDIVISGTRMIRQAVDDNSIMLSGSYTFGRGGSFTCNGADVLINPGSASVNIGDWVNTNTFGKFTIYHLSNLVSAELVVTELDQTEFKHDVIINGKLDVIVDDGGVVKIETASGAVGESAYTGYQGNRAIVGYYASGSSLLMATSSKNIFINTNSTTKATFINMQATANSILFGTSTATRVTIDSAGLLRAYKDILALDDLVMTGNIIAKDDTSSLVLFGSNTNNKGAYLLLNGALSASGQGNAYLTAGDNTAVATEGDVYLRHASNGVITNYAKFSVGDANIYDALTIDGSIKIYNDGAGTEYINFAGTSGPSGIGFRYDDLNQKTEFKERFGSWQTIHHKSSARVRLASNQVMTGSGVEQIDFNTEDWDKLFEFNTGTFTFTAINSGRYIVCGNVSVTTLVAPMYVAIQVNQNGINKVETSGYNNISVSNTSWVVPFTTVLDITAGDTITIDLVKNLATTYTILAAADETWMSVSRIQ